MKLTPRFKFGMNPPLIDGIFNVLPFELVLLKGYEKLKKWSMYSSNCKIFCDLYRASLKMHQIIKQTRSIR